MFYLEAKNLEKIDTKNFFDQFKNQFAYFGVPEQNVKILISNFLSFL